MSEPMTADAARKIVLAKYPHAVCSFSGGWTFADLPIEHLIYWGHPLTSEVIGRGKTVSAAWLNAAQRIGANT